MRGGDEEEGGDMDRSSAPEYCSLSDGIVTPDSAMGFACSSDDILETWKTEVWVEVWLSPGLLLVVSSADGLASDHQIPASIHSTEPENPRLPVEELPPLHSQGKLWGKIPTLRSRRLA